MLTIDGSYGEGGGQILRSSLTLSTILSQPFRLLNIRAKRKNGGLAAQHLTAVQAATAICQAKVKGAELGSSELTFEPHSKPMAGVYEFDVAEARQGGSAGAATLVLQTVLLPLMLADQASLVTVRGGTHVAWSPPFHYLQEVFLPMMAQLGFQATAELLAWGWYPAGQGEIQVTISAKTPSQFGSDWQQRGALKQIRGLAVAANLTASIAQRMADRASKLLNQAGLPVDIEPQRVRSVSEGAGIFLIAEYEASRAGFSALGQRGKSSEQVAEDAVKKLLAFQQSGAVLDEYLTDQLILPLALAGQPITVSAACLSPHTLTNIWVAEQFLGPVVQVDGSTLGFNKHF